MRRFLATLAAILIGLVAPAPWPLPVAGLLLSLAAMGAWSAPGWPACGCLGLPGDHPPIERDGP